MDSGVSCSGKVASTMAEGGLLELIDELWVLIGENRHTEDLLIDEPFPYDDPHIFEDSNGAVGGVALASTSASEGVSAQCEAGSSGAVGGAALTSRGADALDKASVSGGASASGGPFTFDGALVFIGASASAPASQGASTPAGALQVGGTPAPDAAPATSGQTASGGPTLVEIELPVYDDQVGVALPIPQLPHCERYPSPIVIIDSGSSESESENENSRDEVTV